MRSTVNRVPVPAHIRLPVCPSLMVLCCEHIISMKTMSKTHPIVSSMLQIGGFHVTSIDHNSNYREVWGSHVGWGAMLCPIQNSLMFWKILKLLNYSYFAKIMTGKPKIGILTNMTELHFWSQKSGICYLGDFVVTWCHMTTTNTYTVHQSKNTK